MSFAIAGVVALVAAAVAAYADRNKLKAKVLAAEGQLLSEALKLDAALRAKEVNIKAEIKVALASAVSDATDELGTAGVDAVAVLGKVFTRIRAAL